VPPHVCYMFRPVLRPSSGMSIQRMWKRNIQSISFLYTFPALFLHVFTCVINGQGNELWVQSRYIRHSPRITMHTFKDYRLRVPPTSAVSASAMLLLIAERQAVYYNVTLWRARKMFVSYLLGYPYSLIELTPREGASGDVMSPATIQRTQVLKCHAFLPNLNEIWFFSIDVLDSCTSNFREICPLPVAVIHTDRQMDGHEEAHKSFSRLCKHG
jgi:hypothetical protein